MENREDCIALVASIPVSFVSDMLSLDKEDALTYAHIIRRDGSYVIRGGKTYFDGHLVTDPEEVAAAFGHLPYWQVRADRLGFIGGLSVLDLIFNLGPEAALHIRRR